MLLRSNPSGCLPIQELKLRTFTFLPVAQRYIRTSAPACTAVPEAGGYVGGVVVTLSANSTWCTDNKNTHGQTGGR